MIGKRLGQGKTAEVFAYGQDLALKLFYADHRDDGLREYDKAMCIQGLDLPMAKCHGLIKTDDRIGILYDRVDGISGLELLEQENGDEALISFLAETHKTLLSCAAEGLPDYADILRKHIVRSERMTTAWKEKMLERLEGLPKGRTLCHGDLHPDNLLIKNGCARVIDFMNISVGHPNFDMARTAFLLKYAPFQGIRQERRDRLTAGYLQCMGIEENALTPYLQVIAAARVGEMRHAVEEQVAAKMYLKMHGF